MLHDEEHKVNLAMILEYGRRGPDRMINNDIGND
jgi:hypothetical protein